MSASQRSKGARGERQACRALEETTGEAWERTGSAQRRVGSTLPDVRPVESGSVRDLMHVEVKLGARPSPHGALEQAREQCDKTGRIPVAMTRRDRGRWAITCDLEDLAVVAAALATIREEQS